MNGRIQWATQALSYAHPQPCTPLPHLNLITRQPAVCLSEWSFDPLAHLCLSAGEADLFAADVTLERGDGPLVGLALSSGVVPPNAPHPSLVAPPAIGIAVAAHTQVLARHIHDRRSAVLAETYHTLASRVVSAAMWLLWLWP